MIVDAWIQHPTPAFLRHPMFASLRRWTGMETPEAVPPAFTLGALESAGVDKALVSAWWGPAGALIDNDAVAAFVAERPDMLFGVASVDLARPMEAVRELRRA
ncbi:MAG: amidohydrolase, partial [Candidatus Methylomirabilis sp.]|nr:amidohydrolase [Deltaproteobacteria bacterium]